MLITETFSKVLLKFYVLFCVCMYCADLMVWINPLISVSLKIRLPEGYCKCMCVRERERERLRERERERDRERERETERERERERERLKSPLFKTNR